MEPGARMGENVVAREGAWVELRRPEDPITEDRMVLAELLQKSGDGDFHKTVAEAVLQILMEADVEALIGAGCHARSADRLNYRDRSLDTWLGTLSLCIPK